MANRNKRKIQTLIFDKRYYRTRRQIKRWLSDNPEFKLLKYKRQPIEKNEQNFIVRQREPRYFKKSSFKTIKFNKSGTIKAVVGILN